MTVRAALSVALLGGYWVGRVVIPGALLCVTLLSWWFTPGLTAVVVTAVTLFAVIAGLRAAHVVRHAASRRLTGTVVAPTGDSALWREVRDLCARLGVRPPEEIRIGREPVIETWEQPGRLGLAAGPRQLYLGLPLLAALKPPQLRSLLVHELAHDARDAGRLPAVCHRAHTVLGAVLVRRPASAALVFALWARLFLWLEKPVSVAQEWRADGAAARLAGRSAAAAALRELPVVTYSWHRYLSEVIAPAARDGYAPLSLSDGFDHTRHAWRAELDALRAAPPAERPPAWDAHPSRLERLLAFDVAFPGAGPVGETIELRSRLSTVVRQVERDLLGNQVSRVPWEEFLAITESQPLRGEVAQLYEAATSVARVDGLAGLDAVLRLLEDRRADELVASLDPPDRGTARRLLAVAFALAAVDGGVARWRRSSTGNLTVVRPDGGAVPVEELAARVLVDPDTVSMVREVLRLVEHSRTGQFV